MYNYITGKIVKKKPESNICIVDVNGIGYELVVPESTIKELSVSEDDVKFYVVEVSSGLYSSGLPTLYGFLTEEEKEIFIAFKDNLANVGPKKALEYLDKVKKNIAEFKTAIKTKNYKLLISLFGFRHSSAEKIINTLSNLELFTSETVPTRGGIDAEVYTDIISALVNLGYKESQVKNVVEKVLAEHSSKTKVKHSQVIQELLPIILRELSMSK